VLSWLLLGGKCRDCKLPISSLYPTIELLVGLLGGLLFVQTIPDASALSTGALLAFGVKLVFVAMLVAQTYIDLRHYIIPNELSIYAAPFGILAALALGHLGHSGGPTWQSAVVGALAGGGLFGGIKLLYWLVRRREGIGDGDIKLAAMIGAFLGLPAIPFVILASSVTGALVGVPIALLQRKGAQLALPFGPFLALGAIVYLLHGPPLMARLFPGLDLLFGPLAS
jgi:leader peptidase (prepilin peptidase)/N-methyltransferase